MSPHTTGPWLSRLAGCLLLALLPGVSGRAWLADAPPPTAAGGHVVAPVAIRRVAPVHPPELRKDLINGDVVLDGLVDAEGVVHDITVVSSTHAGFEPAAKEALEQWEFTPGTIDGKPAPIRVRVPFEFRLSPDQVLSTIAGRPVYLEVKETVIPAGQLPSWPRPLQFYLPRYPAELEGTGKYGKAVVNITIDKEGKVINPRLVKATYPEFILPSLVTALKLQFPPQVMANREKIYVNMDIQFDFKTPESKAKAVAKDGKDKAAAKDKAAK